MHLQVAWVYTARTWKCEIISYGRAVGGKRAISRRLLRHCVPRNDGRRESHYAAFPRNDGRSVLSSHFQVRAV